MLPAPPCTPERTREAGAVAAGATAARAPMLLVDGATSDNLRFANAASLPVLDVEGARGTRSANGLLDKVMLLLLPRSSSLMVL